MLRQRLYRKRRIAEMNVVPYIDVMLVLLIIFMITSPLLTQGVDVELPTVEQAKTLMPEPSKLVVITLNADGEIFINDNDEAVSESELLTQVAALMRLTPGSQVLIRGHARLAYGEVVQIMGLLREAGIEQVGLVTQLPQLLTE
ncbi:MAG: protein TolR [Pseudomonadota bacterium]|nr:protein TolR [Pseudomonadota bacterium]